MRSVDQPESYAPLGAPIRPEPTKPPAPRPEGPSGVVTINGKAQTTSHPKPPMRNYSDILDTQGMVHRESFPPNSLKWVGEAADAWRGMFGPFPAYVPNASAEIREAGSKINRDREITPEDFGIPAEYCDRARNYAEFCMHRAEEQQTIASQHAQQAADMEVIRDMGRKADRD